MLRAPGAVHVFGKFATKISGVANQFQINGNYDKFSGDELKFPQKRC